MAVEILLRNSSGFKELNESYFTAFNNDITPQTIARPKTSHEVSLLVKEAAQTNAAVAIRGAGHTPWEGAANIDDGMTIDLRGVRGINLRTETSSVEIAAGETWGSVYDRLALDGLATTGGRVARVGIMGLTLGGQLCLNKTTTLH
jgi:FAD/FMN-containing dehydrogenase